MLSNFWMNLDYKLLKLIYINFFYIIIFFASYNLLKYLNWILIIYFNV